MPHDCKILNMGMQRNNKSRGHLAVSERPAQMDWRRASCQMNRSCGSFHKQEYGACLGSRDMQRYLGICRDIWTFASTQGYRGMCRNKKNTEFPQVGKTILVPRKTCGTNGQSHKEWILLWPIGTWVSNASTRERRSRWNHKNEKTKRILSNVFLHVQISDSASFSTVLCAK